MIKNSLRYIGERWQPCLLRSSLLYYIIYPLGFQVSRERKRNTIISQVNQRKQVTHHKLILSINLHIKWFAFLSSHFSYPSWQASRHDKANCKVARVRKVLRNEYASRRKCSFNCPEGMSHNLQFQLTVQIVLFNCWLMIITPNLRERQFRETF